MRQVTSLLLRCVMQRYMWTSIVLLYLPLSVSAANNPVSDWFETVFSDPRKALLLVACVSAGVTAVVVSLLCYVRMHYIRRRELEDHFGAYEHAPGNIPPPEYPDPFNPPPEQSNPFNPPPEQPNPFSPTLEPPNPFDPPPDQPDPSDSSSEQPSPFIDPSEQPNPLDSNAPSASNNPTRSNPIPIPSSRQTRRTSFYYRFDQTDSESSQGERSLPSSQDDSSRSRGRPRHRRAIRARSMSDSDISRNRRDLSGNRLASSSSDSALDERYLYANPRRRRVRYRRQRENRVRVPGVSHDEPELLFSTDEARQLANHVRAALHQTDRVHARRHNLRRLNHVQPRPTILQQELIAGPSSRPADNTGMAASGSTSGHLTAAHLANIREITGVWPDQVETLFAVDGRRLLLNRIRAILQNANTVRSHRVVLQHTDRVQSQQAIVEEMPSAGPSGTTADITGIVASSSASEVPAAAAQSPSPQEHNAASSSSEHVHGEFHTPVSDSPPSPALQEDSGSSSSSETVHGRVRTPDNNSPPPYWRFTEHFD
ncbi:hypothetical protein EDD15DRAFT_2527925 [Pisolithus albus]|nr:hypothetical protein EDD15DRAFT_2527925 [Pisolithus albus]